MTTAAQQIYMNQAIEEGIDHTYIKLVDAYLKIEAEIQSPVQRGQEGYVNLFSSDLWTTFTWGMSLMASAMKGFKRLYDDSMKDREDKSQQEIDQIISKNQNYYVPYLTFVDQYIDISRATVEAEAQSLSNSIHPKDYIDQTNKILDSFDKDILLILKQCAINCSNEVLVQQFLNPKVEKYAFEKLKTTDYGLFRHAFTVIGQFVALGEQSISMKYLTQTNLIDNIQWALAEGAQPLRNDALWIMQNLACSPDAANKILDKHTGILSNLLGEIKRKNVMLKYEAAMTLANILEHCSNSDLIQNLIRLDMMAILHDELYSGLDHGAFQIIAI